MYITFVKLLEKFSFRKVKVLAKVSLSGGRITGSGRIVNLISGPSLIQTSP